MTEPRDQQQENQVDRSSQDEKAEDLEVRDESAVEVKGGVGENISFNFGGPKPTYTP